MNILLYECLHSLVMTSGKPISKELIQFHTFLLQLKTHLDNMIDNNGGLEFQSYDKLNVTPYQVYKSKREQKLAVFTLSKGIATRLSNNNCPGLEKVSNRLGQMSERFMTEKEKELINTKKSGDKYDWYYYKYRKE